MTIKHEEEGGEGKGGSSIGAKATAGTRAGDGY